MPNIAEALKAEIARVARKEVKAETAQFRKASVGYRHQIAALRKKVEALEKALRQATGTRRRTATTSNGESEERQLRFSATRFAAQRKKLGISAADMALLLGVSGQSVYKWERGEARPRRSQLEAISQVRGLGKKEAAARLEVLAAAA